MESKNPVPAPPEKLFPSLVCNILFPVLLLTQGKRLIADPAWVLVIALAFPVGYFIFDLRRRRKVNFISIIGFISVLLTGGVGLMQLPRFWFIVKEAAIPGLIGLAVLISQRTRWPLLKVLLYNPQIFDVPAIQAALDARGTGRRMERLLTVCNVLLSLSFFFSAALNYVVARHFIRTEPAIDPVQFNAEVGAMTGWSYVIIALPSMAMMIGLLYYLFHGIRQLTGLDIEHLMAVEHRTPNS
jgi:intracellular septation protein A